MKYVYRTLAILIILGLAALTAYSYVGDLSPMQQQVQQPVKLNVD